MPQGDTQREYSGPACLAKYAFQPGVSGNPKGRPRGAVSLVRILDEKLQLVPPGQTLKSWAELLVEKTILDAFSGDGPSRKLVWEYIEGRTSERKDNGGDAPEIQIIDDV